MRIDKYLAKCGLGSRSETRKLIKAKRVKINGVITTNINQKVDGEVRLDGEVITFKEFVYIMLNKPKGVISAAKDDNLTTVVDLLTEYAHYDLFPVGRLDKDTTGLLIITNDGKLTHNIISPKKNKPKTYICTLRDKVQPEYKEMVAKGVQTNDFLAKPGEYKELSDYKASLTIYEGKYHQVKKMFLAMNNEVVELHRESVNGLELDTSLDFGVYRELTEEELNILKN